MKYITGFGIFILSMLCSLGIITQSNLLIAQNYPDENRTCSEALPARTMYHSVEQDEADLKSNKYLLLDSRIIEKTENVKLEVGKVKKHDANPLFGMEVPKTPGVWLQTQKAGLSVVTQTTNLKYTDDTELYYPQMKIT